MPEMSCTSDTEQSIEQLAENPYTTSGHPHRMPVSLVLRSYLYIYYQLTGYLSRRRVSCVLAVLSMVLSNGCSLASIVLAAVSPARYLEDHSEMKRIRYWYDRSLLQSEHCGREYEQNVVTSFW